MDGNQSGLLIEISGFNHKLQVHHAISLTACGSKAAKDVSDTKIDPHIQRVLS